MTSGGVQRYPPGPPGAMLHADGAGREAWGDLPPLPGRARPDGLAPPDRPGPPDGWYVVGDRVQAPSGAGYAMANRRVVARVLAAVHRQSRIHRLRPFFDAVRRGLEELTPDRVPRIVLLTPGPQSETA